jgi:hypothetical protein
MDFGRLQKTLTSHLAAISDIERRCVRILAIVAALSAIALPVLQFLEINRLLSPGEGSEWGVIVSYTSFWLRVRISAALAVTSAGIWPFRGKSFLVSVVSMAWVVVEYALWLTWSLRVRESVGTGKMPEPNAAGLYAATWFDILVLLFSLTMAVWIAKILSTSLKSSAFSNERPSSE